MLLDLHTDFLHLCPSVWWTGIPSKEVWYSHLFKNFLHFVVIHTVKAFNVVNKADVFLAFSCFLCDPADIGNLISGSSAFSKSSLNIWKFLVHIHLKPRLENFEHYFASVWDECNCVIVRTFFGIAFLWNWNETRSLFRRRLPRTFWKKASLME